ncbi:hypothetical protein ACFO1B_45465 [Dactylosporangium siamense]|nr:hypothetical protein [Dactylosporangium siamense]
MEPDLIAELLWLQVLQADRIEHIRARAGPEGFRVALFVNAESATEAQTAVQHFCRRAITNNPQLRGFGVRDQL